ncbi:hypothetical protein JAF86_001639 [Citrobacter braakii]|uniref:hypothetical protein n=1 Tax=Citrobacter TaxID=544 RepID=UPI001C0EE980|nr:MULTISPECIES: hypothetical protein [Citrobacter]EGT0675889.1 hypothetical protein [Citrobacter braakii]MBU5639666.1 hypothetical protein [Citrobacter sp. S46_ASV_140]MEB2304209.1 hypothetical protein [Citrobacter braakii]WFW80466.1 hypothetical protein NFJ84_12150 [Citrobacter braakii]
MNAQGRLTAASLATQAPGGKIVAARFIRLMPSACRVGAEPASLQAVPSARIPAGRPGQPSTPHRFSAGPGSSLQRTDFQLTLFCCSDKKTQGVRCGLVRLKIDDVFPEGRENPQGCGFRARFAGTLPRARPVSLKE